MAKGGQSEKLRKMSVFAWSRKYQLALWSTETVGTATSHKEGKGNEIKTEIRVKESISCWRYVGEVGSYLFILSLITTQYILK